MMRTDRARLRLLVTVLPLAAMTACGTGVNAGVDGGIAFILFTAMLILTCVILYFALGRDD
jgi:hypothetical protein